MTNDILVKVFKSLFYKDLAMNALFTRKVFNKEDWMGKLSEEDKSFISSLYQKIEVDYNSLHDKSYTKSFNENDWERINKIKERLAWDELRDESTISSEL